MECSTKSSKPSSNISEMVSRFAEVCRFRSIGVFSSENPNHHQCHCPNNGPLAEDGIDEIEETSRDGKKVHPHLVEIQTKTNECAHVAILKLFDTISVLKTAYVRLQEAHIPYDPENIKAADEFIVSQLDALCNIKRAYKERQFEEPKAISSCSDLLLDEIQVQERLLEKLKSETRDKVAEILKLKRELQVLDLKNRKLAQEFRQREKENLRFFNSFLFEDIVKAASKAIHDFAKPLIALMKVSGWDLDRAANSVEDSVVYSKRSHKKYAFEAYIARRMFYGISLQSYNFGGILKIDDPFDALIEDPDSGFAKFCRTKYLLVVHPKMEASFFGDLDHRLFVSRGRHPRTQFYQAFAKVARWVWVLQGIAASTEPNAEIFGVKRGSEFSDNYMQCVEELKEDMVVFDETQARFIVEFMVMPGFRIGERLVKSQVYLSKIRYPNGVC